MGAGARKRGADGRRDAMMGQMSGTTGACWRALRVVLAVALVAVVTGCGGGSGGATSPSVSVSESPDPGPSEPVSDETVCGLFSTTDLSATLGFEVYSYRYRSAPAGVVRGDWYMCLMRTEDGDSAEITVNYSWSDQMWVSEDEPSLRFDDIPTTHADTAQALSFEAVEGSGWAWDQGSYAYVAWRYPSGYMVVAQMVSFVRGGLTPEEVDGFREVLEPVLGGIPGVAEGPAQSDEVPAPSQTGTASTGTDSSSPTP